VAEAQGKQKKTIKEGVDSIRARLWFWYNRKRCRF